MFGALVAAGSLLGAYASMEEGNTQNLMAQFNAQNALENAKLVRLKAKEDERQLRVMARKEIGAMRANFGASGITMEGSALDVLMESAAAAEHDALAIRKQGDMQARALEREARMQSALGGRAARAGQIGAVASILGGAARYADRG